MQKRFSKEQYRKWGERGGSPILKAFKQGRVSIDGKKVTPATLKARKRK